MSSGAKDFPYPFFRMVAALLALPVIWPYIMWPDFLLWHPAHAPLIAYMSGSFRLLVIGLAIYAFATWPANGRVIPYFVSFLIFPIAYALNPVDLVWKSMDGFYCSSLNCADATLIGYVTTLAKEKAVPIAWEITAFFALFLAVRVAAGKMWPGKPRRA